MKGLRILMQTAVLAAFLWAGTALGALLRLPLPGNVLGLALLFLGLQTGLVRLAWVEEAADFLLRHLVCFFIAAAVDLMNWGGVFRRHGLRLALVVGIGTVLTLLVSGGAAQALLRRRHPCRS